jgi:hypothetical protein
MGGGGVPANQTKQTEVVVPDWVQAQVEQNIETSNQLAATAYQTPPVPTVAAMAPDQLAAIQQIENLQGTYNAPFDQAISTVTNLPQSIAALLSPEIPGAEATAVQQIQRQGAQTGQQIAAQAVGAGALGGSRYGVQQSLNDSSTQQQIAAAVNQIASGGYTQAANEALTGASNLGQLTAANLTGELTGANALYQVGAQEQAETQAGYSAALQQWQQAQQYPYQQLAIQQSALAGSPYGNTVTATQPYSSNALASDLGLAASAIPLGVNLSNWTGLSSALGGLFGTAAPAVAGTAAIGGGSAAAGAIGGVAADTAIEAPLWFGASDLGAAGLGAAGLGADAAATAAADAAATAGAGAAGKGAGDLVAAAAPALLA